MIVELPDVEGPFHIHRVAEDKLEVRIDGAGSAAKDPRQLSADETADALPDASSIRTFAGFRLSTLAVAVLIAALLAWNAWMTREVIALERHRVVSVSLASIITDFVRDQAHSQGSPDEAATRTRMYLIATQKALVELAKNGTPVLASEAVLGNSVPDNTIQVKQAVAKAMAQAAQH